MDKWTHGPMEGPIKQLTDGPISSRDANLHLKTIIPTSMDGRMDRWTNGLPTDGWTNLPIEMRGHIKKHTNALWMNGRTDGQTHQWYDRPTNQRIDQPWYQCALDQQTDRWTNGLMEMRGRI